jgi:hypothetical protein
VALLRLLDGTVWMLVLQGERWCSERLWTAAKWLAHGSAQAFTTSSVERLLREKLDTPSLSVSVPPVAGIDERLWEIDKVVFALANRPDAQTDYPDARSELCEWRIRKTICGRLDDLVQRFFEAMHPEAFKIATTDRCFDLRVYNYLVHEDFRHYRLQFAGTFPSLLQSAVVARPGGFGEELRSIVDAGQPLIKGLASRWGVRPGVIRHLVGRASSGVGAQWARDARGLAVALNALHPQDVPGDDPAEWREFNRMAVTGQRLFLQPVWKSSAGLKWLRMCVRLSRRGDTEALARWMPPWNNLDRVARFRAALTESLRRESAGGPVPPAGDIAVVEAVDEVVLNIADQGLKDAATQFAEELERARESERIRQIRSNEALLALVPQDFISSDGSTRVTPLCTRHQLYRHGQKI